MPVRLTDDLAETAWAVSQAMREPVWAKRERKVARLVTGGLGLPSPRDERWRRTDLTRLGLDLSVINAPDPARLEPVSVSGGDRVAIRLPTAVASELDGCQDMCTFPEPQDLLEALHRALWSDGVLLDLPAGHVTPAPVTIHLPAPPSGSSVFYTLILRARAGSRGVVIIEDQDGPATVPGSPTPRLSYTHIFVVLEPGAALTCLAGHGRKSISYDFTRVIAVLGEQSALDWTVVPHGHPGVVRYGLEANLQGTGASAQGRFLYTADARQPVHLDLGGQYLHRARLTQSRIVTRGVLAGQARAVLRGFTDIEKGAARSKAYQHMQALLLDSRARADSIPALKVDENDVQAGHATAAGPLDQDQVFYLTSRGLDPATARRLMITGFYEPVLVEVPAALRDLARLYLGLAPDEEAIA